LPLKSIAVGAAEYKVCHPTRAAHWKRPVSIQVGATSGNLEKQGHFRKFLHYQSIENNGNRYFLTQISGTLLSRQIKKAQKKIDSELILPYTIYKDISI
jgi:hypothetical protein